MRSLIRYSLLISLGAAAACGGGDDLDDPADDPTDDPQQPPRGAARVTTWIEAGFYLGWACEPEPHAARPPSPHGTNRICSNAAIADASEGPFAVGAAAVKELRDDSGIIGYAVYRKLADEGDGDNWYWYEVAGGEVIADGDGSGGPARAICVDCHSHAPRDFVFTRVQ
jgi:hypothetical protein